MCAYIPMYIYTYIYTHRYKYAAELTGSSNYATFSSSFSNYFLYQLSHDSRCFSMHTRGTEAECVLAAILTAAPISDSSP